MSITGTVKNGVIVLPAGVTLPDGTEVTVEPVPTDADDAFVSTVEKLAKPRPHLAQKFRSITVNSD